jgi:hypothetical protein
VFVAEFELNLFNQVFVFVPVTTGHDSLKKRKNDFSVRRRRVYYFSNHHFLAALVYLVWAIICLPTVRQAWLPLGTTLCCGAA